MSIYDMNKLAKIGINNELRYSGKYYHENIYGKYNSL
jgi:hypothetical protein